MNAISKRAPVWNSGPKQVGLTLIELMVSLLIGLLLMGGALQVFLSSKGTYDAQQEAARLQENVRFANRFLTRDLRGVGFLGCGSNTTPINLFEPSAPFELDTDAMIRGWRSSTGGANAVDLGTLAADAEASTATHDGSDAPPSGFNVRQGSDIVQIWVAQGSARVEGLPGGGASEIVPIEYAQGFADEGAVFITNCVDAYITPYCDYTPGDDELTINDSCDHGISSTFGGLTYPADAIGLVSHVYYIGENTVGRPALYRRTLDLSDGSWGDALELVEGVEAMRIEYGVAGGSSGRVNSYESAADVSNWEQVVSVRFGLLMLGEGRFPSSDATDNEYELFGQAFTVPDGDERLRRVTSTTVTLRNRTN